MTIIDALSKQKVIVKKVQVTCTKKDIKCGYADRKKTSTKLKKFK